MKKTVFISLLFVTVVSAFLGCRKAYDDPFFSIHSRKARVVGDWKVTTYTINDSDQIAYTQTGTLPTALCGTASFSNTITNNLTFTFAKDGTYSEGWQHVLATSTTYSLGCPADATSQDTTINSKGSWMFTGGTDRTKYKGMLSLFDNNLRLNNAFDITYLANKQIRLEQEVTDTTGYFRKTILILDKK